MRKIVLILAAALVLRVLIVWVWTASGNAGRIADDGTGYYAVAQNLTQGLGFSLSPGSPFSRQLPLYSIFLAFLIKLGLFPTGVYLAQALLGTAVVLMVYGIARIFFSNNAALWAAGLYSFDYAAIRQTVVILPEVLFSFFLFLGLFFLLRSVRKDRKNVVVSGLFFGLTLLTKGVMVLFLPFVLAWFFIFRVDFKSSFTRAAFFLTGLALALGPWAYYTNVLGQASVRSSWAGHTFYLANNPQATGGTTGGDWTFLKDTGYPRNPKMPKLYTAEADRFLFRKGIEFITHQPDRFLWLMGRKIINMWRPYQTDSPAGAKAAMAATYLPILFLGIAGMVMNVRRWKQLFVLFCFVFYVFILHAVLIAHIRYRFPVMPVFAIFAGCCAASLWAGLRKKSESGVVL